ncbi:MAG: LemA family protein [Candidatus Ancillula sp.]|jgi:LemA protein|nr:LemA family protein [Candidatus Ancillula sp.]
MSTSTIVIIAIVVVLLILLIGMYNNLVKLREIVNKAFKDINVQLKRRADLFTNLTETVKGYASHESGIFEQFAQARKATMESAKNPTAENQKLMNESFGSALTGMRAIAEQYPDLKANENFAQLQSSIEATENDIQNARSYYNGVVREYNTKIKVFPQVIFAKIFGFGERDYWDSGNQEELDKGLDTTNVAVKF